MNLLRDLSNVVLYSLFILDVAYTFVINNKFNTKSIKKSSSEKNLHAASILLDNKPMDLKPIKYIESIEYLDDGEVSWEIPVKILEKDEPAIDAKIVVSKLVEYNMNPNYSILSGVVKGLNKEIFRLDTVYDILVTWKTHSYVSNILLLVFASLFKYGSDLIVQSEVDGLKNSYNETKNVEYMKRYIKIRRFTSTIILLAAFILTKNVQIAQ